MKKIIITLSVVILAFVAISQVSKKEEEKKYKVELTLQEWDAYVQGFEYVKGKLRNSDIPSKEVALISDSLITKFQGLVVTQVQAQMKADTTKTKK